MRNPNFCVDELLKYFFFQCSLIRFCFGIIKASLEKYQAGATAVYLFGRYKIIKILLHGKLDKKRL